MHPTTSVLEGKWHTCTDICSEQPTSCTPNNESDGACPHKPPHPQNHGCKSSFLGINILPVTWYNYNQRGRDASTSMHHSPPYMARWYSHTVGLAVDTRRRLPLPSNFWKTANQVVVTMFKQTLIVSHMCASFKGEIELETGIRVNLHIPLL
jgi:hypothetical protein